MATPMGQRWQLTVVWLPASRSPLLQSATGSSTSRRTRSFPSLKEETTPRSPILPLWMTLSSELSSRTSSESAAGPKVEYYCLILPQDTFQNARPNFSFLGSPEVAQIYLPRVGWGGVGLQVILMQISVQIGLNWNYKLEMSFATELIFQISICQNSLSSHGHITCSARHCCKYLKLFFK